MSDTTKLKVFVASSNELDAERKETVMILTEMNKRHPHLYLEPVLYELDTESGNYPGKERIQDEINPLLDQSDIVIALFYSKIGIFSREEFDRSIDQNKKIFLYFKSNFQTKKSELLKKYLELAEFREGIEQESKIRFQEFDSLKDYNGTLYKDLEKYLIKQYPPKNKDGEILESSSKKLIPLAPRPYIAHPYSLAKNFTGRVEEMNKLTDWFHLKKEPLLIIEAIGGMGKSALTWKWLHDEIINQDTEVEGIIWWSFYDEPFSAFVKHLFQYVFSEKERQQMGMVDELTELSRALYQRRFLLILDGFERELRGYAQMMSMYIQEGGLSKGQIEDMWDKLQRDPVHPKATKFIRSLCGAQTKTLMTTRLFPSPLEDRMGIQHLRLTGLSDTDTIEFFKKEGIKGSPEEMVEAGKVYHNHPLMLKLLSSAIRRSFTKNIGQAWNKNIINLKEPQKILETSFALLNKEEKKVASAISVFRTAFSFDAAKALFPKMTKNRLEEILYELHQLGFVFYQEQEEVFDFHPIMRSYLYNGMTRKASIHQRAIVYFQAIPGKEKIVSLADLEPVIEQYYHLVRAGKFDEANEVYSARLFRLLYYQLGEYSLAINLIEELFLSKEDILPNLKSKVNQFTTVNRLGLLNSNLGKLRKSRRYYFIYIKGKEEVKSKLNMARGLCNLSDWPQLYIGCQTFFIINLRKAKTLIQKEGSPLLKADICYVLGKLFKFQGKFGFNSNNKSSKLNAVINLNDALKYYKEDNNPLVSGMVANNYSTMYLYKIRISMDTGFDLFQNALSWSMKALNFHEEGISIQHPYPQGFIALSYSFGALLLQFKKYKQVLPDITTVFPFYDEHFQKITEKQPIEQNNLLRLAERCITEALTRSRKINLVEYEPMILLSLAQLDWLKIQNQQKSPDHFPEIETHLQEAHEIAARGPYRIYLADIHLFCAETLIEITEQKLPLPNQLLDADAATHIALAKENALDQSTIDDVYQSDDPNFYDGIPEYEMLKRGLTDQERIENGYYVAWQVAERLEQRLNTFSRKVDH